MNTTWGVIKPDYMRTTTSMEPTRVCSVCGAYERKDAIAYYSKSEFWLCPECLKGLKKLLDKSMEE